MNNVIVVTLVLYKMKMAETPNYALLKKILNQNDHFYVVIYDNSPQMQSDDFFTCKNVWYIHNKENPGLATAYNTGISCFNHVNGDLLVLLDQDTVVTTNYFEKLSHLNLDKEVEVFVPIVNSGGKRISPVFSDKYVGHKSNFPQVGVTTEKIMAINSGTALTRNAIETIQLFHLEFKLDFLDHWLFFELCKANSKIEVMDIVLEHDLSVLNYDEITLERYNSIISAESLFYRRYDTGKFKKHRRHLVVRAVKQFFFVKNRLIWRRTFLEYFRLMRGK